MLDNICLLTDSYKPSHWKQYPPKTEKVYSYLTAREGFTEEIVFHGLQYLLKRYLAGVVLTKHKIEYAKQVYDAHLGPNIFNYEGWLRLCDKHHGSLPVEICAVPEGTVWPTQTPLMTIENTDPEFPWLTNYLETLLVQVWYPCTVATNSREIKKIILNFLERTGDPALIDFKLHDFGFRGVSSVESAGIGGTAHLVNFKGSDTVAALLHSMRYYGLLTPDRIAAFSIPAAEHSTITSWGREHEEDAYRNMLESFPNGLVAVVSDSYNIWEACEKLWGGSLKDKVLNRNGTLVVRPDSGYPVYVVKEVLRLLGEQFGYEFNEKGFKVLPSQIRVIQGDGIDRDMIQEILAEITFFGWSTDNVAFGMGGALLQKVDRDTLSFAMKASEVTVDGEVRSVSKSPVTQRMKASVGGRKSVLRDGVEMLVPVFRDGELLRDFDFDEVRKNATVSPLIS